tara:strand:+ start:793 stop:3396 length:2604 start_codon:yes stop_codon:yes gene_type:complete
MILKKEKKKIKKNSFYNLNKFLFIYFSFTLIIGIIFIIFIIQSVFFQQAKQKILDLSSKAGRFEYLYLPNIAVKAFKSNFYKLEEINLEIKFNNSLILENVRKKSIERGGLPETVSNPMVKFNLTSNDEKYSGDIRLKGERKVHFIEKEKSSYKIKLRENQYYLGLKKFSLQKPRLRNYVHEWIFHAMAEDFDLIKIKYEFLNLSINGEDKGLYVLEEGFGKELVERNKRRNGPIFGLNEDLSAMADDPIFEIYNKTYWAKDENKHLVENASQKLRDFFSGKIVLEDVFDMQKWSTYFAIIDITSTYHGALLKSVKLYYNPINGLFEPIPYDGHRLKPNYNKFNLNYDDRILIDIIDNPIGDEISAFTWLKRFFYKKNGELNSLFYNLYIDNLNTISSKKYLNKFFSENLDKIKKINSHIYSDYFYYDNSRNYGMGLYYFLLSDFFHQSDNIKQKLKSKKKIQITKKNNSEFLIRNHYRNYGALLVDKLICKKDDQDVVIKIDKRVNNFSDTILNIPLEQMKDLDCTHINLIDKLENKPILLKIDYINAEYNYKKFKNDEQNKWSQYFFEKDMELFLLRDEVNIDNDLYIPRGFSVIIKEGQKILLTNNAFIVSNSPWTIGGTKKKTIITGEKNNLGGGIIIGDNDGLSKISNTKISYLNGYNIELNFEFLIMGSINFHQTNVEINNVDFENIFSEDAINIIRSKFKINNSRFKNISSDAIDSDFSNGKIESVSFENITNDAMDFSGSIVEIYDSNFENVQDKLISGGEESNIKISKIKAVNSKSGIISKDGSKIYSNNIFFNNVKIPFAAYQKKSQYNHGLLVVNDFKVDNFLVKFAKDDESQITLNNIIQSSAKINKKMLSLVNQ